MRRPSGGSRDKPVETSHSGILLLREIPMGPVRSGIGKRIPVEAIFPHFLKIVTVVATQATV